MTNMPDTGDCTIDNYIKLLIIENSFKKLLTVIRDELSRLA